MKNTGSYIIFFVLGIITTLSFKRCQKTETHEYDYRTKFYNKLQTLSHADSLDTAYFGRTIDQTPIYDNRTFKFDKNEIKDYIRFLDQYCLQRGNDYDTIEINLGAKLMVKKLEEEKKDSLLYHSLYFRPQFSNPLQGGTSVNESINNDEVVLDINDCCPR